MTDLTTRNYLMALRSDTLRHEATLSEFFHNLGPNISQGENSLVISYSFHNHFSLRHDSLRNGGKTLLSSCDNLISAAELRTRKEMYYAKEASIYITQVFWQKKGTIEEERQG